MILGDNQMTLNRKKANFRGHYVSYERKFRGHLKKSRAKSPILRDRENPGDCTLPVAKTKALISCVLTYAKSRFPHDTAHLFDVSSTILFLTD